MSLLPTTRTAPACAVTALDGTCPRISTTPPRRTRLRTATWASGRPSVALTVRPVLAARVTTVADAGRTGLTPAGLPASIFIYASSYKGKSDAVIEFHLDSR